MVKTWEGTRRQEGVGAFSVKAGLRPIVVGAEDAAGRRRREIVQVAAQRRAIRAAERPGEGPAELAAEIVQPRVAGEGPAGWMALRGQRRAPAHRGAANAGRAA